MKRLLLTLPVVLFAANLACGRGERTSQGSLDAHFSSDKGIEWAVEREIDEAERSIEAAVYSFTSRPLAQALVDAGNRGVKVRVIIDPSNASGRFSKAAYLIQNGIRVRTEKGLGLMHHKFALIDDTVLITGSFNWTASAEEENDENVLVLKGFPSTRRAYSGEFERIWRQARAYTGRPPEPNYLFATDLPGLKKHVNQRVIVQGKVARVGYSGSSNTYFLDFSTGGEDFTAVIFSSGVEKFEHLGISIPDYEGNRVEVRGELIDHPTYGLEIIVEEPSQIEMQPQ